MAMANHRKLKNGDIFRVVQGKALFQNSWMIQAKEINRESYRWYNIGRKDNLAEAIQEMNRLADIADVKELC
jgi:hypothetical protein